MKIYSTNYINTFIEVAEDCPISQGEVPPQRGKKKSVANLQFDLIQADPNRYTSDDLLFKIYAMRKELPREDWDRDRQQYFSKDNLGCVLLRSQSDTAGEFIVIQTEKQPFIPGNLLSTNILQPIQISPKRRP